MLISTNAVKCTILLAFLVCGVSSIFTSSFFTLRKGSRNPFRMFAPVIDRDTRDDSRKKDDSIIDANDTPLKDENVLENAMGQSARRARSSAQKCGTPKMHSFLLHPSLPVIYWTFRKGAQTCVQDFGFGVRLDGANAFSDIKDCVRECCPASCRPLCCADIAPSYVELTY